jgi:hypothetical protein
MPGTSPTATATNRPEDDIVPDAPESGDATESTGAAEAGAGAGATENETAGGASGDTTAIVSTRHELVRPPEEARPRSKYRKDDDWQAQVLPGKLMYFFGRDAYHPPKPVVMVGATRVNVLDITDEDRKDEKIGESMPAHDEATGNPIKVTDDILIARKLGRLVESKAPDRWEKHLHCRKLWLLTALPDREGDVAGACLYTWFHVPGTAEALNLRHVCDSVAKVLLAKSREEYDKAVAEKKGMLDSDPEKRQHQIKQFALYAWRSHNAVDYKAVVVENGDTLRLRAAYASPNDPKPDNPKKAEVKPAWVDMEGDVYHEILVPGMPTLPQIQPKVDKWPVVQPPTQYKSVAIKPATVVRAKGSQKAAKSAAKRAQFEEDGATGRDGEDEDDDSTTTAATAAVQAPAGTASSKRKRPVGDAEAVLSKEDAYRIKRAKTRERFVQNEWFLPLGPEGSYSINVLPNAACKTECVAHIVSYVRPEDSDDEDKDAAGADGAEA